MIKDIEDFKALIPPEIVKGKHDELLELMGKITNSCNDLALYVGTANINAATTEIQKQTHMSYDFTDLKNEILNGLDKN